METYYIQSPKQISIIHQQKRPSIHQVDFSQAFHQTPGTQAHSRNKLKIKTHIPHQIKQNSKVYSHLKHHW
jgi:hypothetical protein